MGTSELPDINPKQQSLRATGPRAEGDVHIPGKPQIHMARITIMYVTLSIWLHRI